MRHSPARILSRPRRTAHSASREGEKAEGPQKGRVQQRLEGSDDEVLPIWLVRHIASLPLIRRSRRSVAVAAALIGSPPLLAVLAELSAGETVSWFIWSTAALYSVLISVMILGASDAWAQVVLLGPDLDSMLEDGDQEVIVEWMSRALRSWPQILSMLFGIAASTWVGIQLSGPLGGYADHGGPAYSVTIGWTGGIGGLATYWLWGAPALFYPLTRIERPRLDWVAPLQTPAIQKASRLMVTNSRLSTLGLLLFMVPITITVVLASKELSVWILSVLPVIFAVITVLISSMIPQIVLQDLLRRGRRRTLDKIRALLPEPEEVFKDLQPQQMQAIELYRAIANSSVSTLDWKRFVEYVLLMMSAVIPVAIALISSLGS
jgi:hypothetical protein